MFPVIEGNGEKTECVVRGLCSEDVCVAGRAGELERRKVRKGKQREGETAM